MRIEKKVAIVLQMILMIGFGFLALGVVSIYLIFSKETSNPGLLAILGSIATLLGIFFTVAGILAMKIAGKKGIKKLTW